MSLEPHGGTLVRRLVDGDAKNRLVADAASLPRITLNEWQVSDLDMIAVGAMSPLTGFMSRNDYKSVLSSMRLANGTPWPFPITLRVDRETASKIRDRAALHGADGKLLAVLDVADRYEGDKKEEARAIFRTDEEAHPGAAALYTMGDVILAGDVHVVARPDSSEFKAYRLDPADTRAKFRELGWKTIVGFQTRNPIHRAHEYLIKVALEIVDGALVHPLVGATKSDDIPRRRACAATRRSCRTISLRIVRCSRCSPRRCATPGRAKRSSTRSRARTTDARTSSSAAITRASESTTAPYDAQKIFSEFKSGELGITPLMFENSFWCKKSGGMATAKTSNAGPEDRFMLSGTQVRDLLKNGEAIPVEFTRPEVARILMEDARPKVTA